MTEETTNVSGTLPPPSPLIDRPAPSLAQEQEREPAGFFRSAARRRVLARLCVAVLVISSAVLFFSAPTSFKITEAVVSREADGEPGAAGSPSEFPMGTGSVACLFSWEKAPQSLPLQGRWYYLTGNRPILDVPVTLTRGSGRGRILLRMPPGKVFPAGSYQVRFLVNGKVFKTVPFAVAADSSPAPQPAPASLSSE